MKTFIMQDSSTVKELVRVAHATSQPVLVSKASDECLVAMTPSVFEQILCDNDALNVRDRSLLHI